MSIDDCVQSVRRVISIHGCLMVFQVVGPAGRVRFVNMSNRSRFGSSGSSFIFDFIHFTDFAKLPFAIPQGNLHVLRNVCEGLHPVSLQRALLLAGQGQDGKV